MTNRVDPPGAGGSRANEDQVLPAGEYLLAMIWFDRRVSRRGNPYLRCCFLVVAGPLRGRRFFSTWGLDTTKRGTQARWEVWMEQCGVTKAVDLDSDAAIAHAFRGRAFKARVRVEQRDGGELNDIELLVYPRLYTAQDREAIQQWEREWEERGWQHRDPAQAPPHTDEDAPPQAEPAWSDPSWHDGEETDDTPF